MRVTPLFFVCLLLGHWAFAQKLHTPEEILTLLEKSDTKFSMDSISHSEWSLQTATSLADNDDEDVYYVRLEEEEGIRLVILNRDYDRKTEKALKKGDKTFRKKKWSKALDCYQKAYNRRPADPTITNKIGDVYHKQEKIPTALYWYEQSLYNNNGDAYAWWQSALCHRALGEKEKALDEIIQAHLLDRNNAAIQQDVALIAKENGVPFSTKKFEPAYTVKGVPGKKVNIQYTHPIWRAYAAVVALWMYDDAYVQSMENISSDDRYNIMTKEALMNALIVYERQKHPQKAKHFPLLALLSEISLRRQVSPFVMYEISAVRNPMTLMQADAATLEKIKTYLLVYRSKLVD